MTSPKKSLIGILFFIMVIFGCDSEEEIIPSYFEFTFGDQLVKSSDATVYFVSSDYVTYSLTDGSIQTSRTRNYVITDGKYIIGPKWQHTSYEGPTYFVMLGLYGPSIDDDDQNPQDFSCVYTDSTPYTYGLYLFDLTQGHDYYYTYCSEGELALLTFDQANSKVEILSESNFYIYDYDEYGMYLGTSLEIGALKAKGVIKDLRKR